jgi:hypothetical protein
MSQAKSIGNVNILDLRSATEQSVAEIREIGNVNLAIVTKETAQFLQRIQVGNINLVVEVPTGVKIHQSFGRLVMGKEFFMQLAEPIYVLGFGQTIILPDVTTEDIGTKLTGLSVFGQFLLPTTLTGYLESKGSQVFGETVAYVPLAKYHLDSLTLGTSELEVMPDNSELTVIGKLEIPKVLPAGLFSKKIGKLSVTGRIVCHAENQAEVTGSLVEKIKKLTVIPAGFDLVDRPLQLDRYLLESLPGKKLYCTELVRLEKDLSLQDLSANLESLIAKDIVLCPADLRSVFSRICSPLENKVIFYDGEVWVITDSVHLDETQLLAYPDKVTFLVQGKLEIDPKIPVEVLENKLAKVHNQGMIHCSSEQLRTVRLKIGINEGNLQDSSQPQEKEEELDENRSGNINILTL